MTYSDKAVDGLAATDIRAVADAGAALALDLTYAEDGSFELGGINPLMMGMIQGQLAAANLEPDQVAGMTEKGVESVGLQVTPGGILISVNGELLPYLKFDDEKELFDLIDLGGKRESYSAEGREDSSVRVLTGIELFLDLSARDMRAALKSKQLR